MDKRTEDIDPKYKSLIFIDSLTTLYNRYFLYSIFPELKEEAKSQGTELAIFMLDVDNFKYVNDSYGHLRGDSVLKEVARLLKECVRGEDLVIRYAGDEYVILCRGAGYELSRLIGNRIVEKINKNIFKGKAQEAEIHLTISAGFAVYPQDGEDLEELLDCADKALYFSKERGKNRISAASEVTLGTITYKETIKTLSLPKFINRLPEINKLREVWNEVVSAKVFFVLIKGKTGVGKSRLLDEFMQSLSSSGTEALKVICSQRHTLQPYYTLSKAIEDYFNKSHLEISLDSFLSKEELIALAELIPLFKTFIETKMPDKKTAVDSKNLGINLFNGFHHILSELSRQKSLFLYFDNIQYLDKAAFELLRYFLTTDKLRRIMIAGTFGEDEPAEAQLSRENLFSLPKEELVFLDLPPFSLEQTQEFIASIFPNINALTEFSQAVYNITHGNCLFTQETLKCLVEDGKILYKDEQWQLLQPEHLDIPNSLEEVIQRRLKKIDPETKEMLTQAAVMGRDIQLETLRQMIAKDQGYLFDLIDRAREKGILSSQDKIDNLNFISDSTQKAIYGQIDTGQKIDFHRKAEGVIKDLHKDDFQRVIGDLIYHAQSAGRESEVSEYKNRLLGTSLNLFNPQDLVSYLEELGQEVISQEAISSETEIKKIETEISEEVLNKTIDLIRSISAALKNISLYPPLNRIREESVKRVYEQVREMLKGVSSLTFSELERILLVNGKRLSHRLERESVVEHFITVMIERDIKAVQFLPEIEDREINTLLTVLSQEPDDLRKKGGPGQALTEEKVSHIKIDTVNYERLTAKKTSHPFKERLSNVMLFDFLLGRSAGEKTVDASALANQLKNAPQALAKDLIEASRAITQQSGLRASDISSQAKIIVEGIEKLGKEILPGGWQAHKEDLAKLFLSLDKPLQSGLISMASKPEEQSPKIVREVVTNLSDNQIVEVIAGGEIKGKDSVLEMKDLFNKLASEPGKKDKLKPLLEEKLKTIGVQEPEISFVTQKEYKSLTLKERIDALLKLPAELYSSVGKDEIKALLEELFHAQDKDNLREIVAHILAQLEKASGEAKETLYQILNDLISLIPPSNYEFDVIIQELILCLGKRLQQEEAGFYPALLKEIEIMVNWIVSSASALAQERWIMRQRFMGLNNLISGLYSRLEIKEESDQMRIEKELIKDTLFRVSKLGLTEVLIQQLQDSSLEYNRIIEELILKFGDSCLEGLIDTVIQAKGSSFEDYLYRRKIGNILLKAGQPAIDKVKNYISQEKDPLKLRLLIEIVGNKKTVELLDALQLLISHKDPEIRKEVILALSTIIDPRAKELLTQMSGDPEPQVAQLARVKLEALKKIK